MAYWWSNSDDENLFMEITHRENIGEDLRAPLSARGGLDTPGYTLVGSVKKGDLVIHYDGESDSIVGVSRATGERFYQPVWWAALGTYARKAGVKPKWVPGLYVELERYQPLAAPLPLPIIQQRLPSLFAIRDELRTRYPRESLYFPWTPYRDTLRTFQSYLAKFPKAALQVLSELVPVVAQVSTGQQEGIINQETEDAARVVATASGRPRPRRTGTGQRSTLDQRVKAAVEAHAMNAALAHYRAFGRIIDTSRHESYDYEVEIDNELWHVDVKGTSGDASEVLLTENEVEHACEFPRVALFVLSNIVVVRDQVDVTVTGGKPLIFHPWKIDTHRLIALGYRYPLA
jgi:hypothetical protein